MQDNQCNIGTPHHGVLLFATSYELSRGMEAARTGGPKDASVGSSLVSVLDGSASRRGWAIGSWCHTVRVIGSPRSAGEWRDFHELQRRMSAGFVRRRCVSQSESRVWGSCVVYVDQNRRIERVAGRLFRDWRRFSM